MRVNTPFRAALAVAVLVAGTVLGAATPASADSCPKTRDVTIDGAVAHWTLKCKDTRLYVDGWVKDTRHDAMCARVTIEHKYGVDWPQACGSGKRVTFHKSYPEGQKSAKVKLQLVY
ncbi:hypothetical protein [Streptomyces hirsutus]|uniref:hypothetical protein n=1 Tax=Streptomyces hirsutus TaxID=35620 RepID=UPI0006E3CA45|nr:hypothetical protein [Streptomyces hirsutus]